MCRALLCYSSSMLLLVPVHWIQYETYFLSTGPVLLRKMILLFVRNMLENTQEVSNVHCVRNAKVSLMLFRALNECRLICHMFSLKLHPFLD